MCVVCVISGLIDLLPRKRVHVFGRSCSETNGMDRTQTQLGNGLGSLFIRLLWYNPDPHDRSHGPRHQG